MISQVYKDLPVNENGWQTEWPAERWSLWFFYGWTNDDKHTLSQQPRLFSVAVAEDGNQQSMYITDSGSFLYKEAGASGMWRRQDLPPGLPDLQKQFATLAQSVQAARW
jgi:hypothetical protein